MSAGEISLQEFIGLDGTRIGTAHTSFYDDLCRETVAKERASAKKKPFKNKVDLFLYANEKAKLYAIGDFAMTSKEIEIVIHNSNKTKQTYQLKDNPVELNSNINSSDIKDMDVSLTNINFKIKDINLNQTL